MTDRRRRSWERASLKPMMTLGVVFFVAYAVPIVRPDLDPALVRMCTIAQWVVWGVFAVDYVARLQLASDKRTFAKRNLLDLAAVLLPMLRPLQLLRMVSTALLASQRSSATTRYRVTTYVSGTTLFMTVLASLAVLNAERGQAGATIESIGDAFWWSFVTVTTVGYGDMYPVTSTGRVIAVVLMLTAVAMLGVLTANIASWFVERFSARDGQAAHQRDRLDTVIAELDRLRKDPRFHALAAELAAVRAAAVADSPPPPAAEGLTHL